jgi:UDP-glucuronate decarboxylase
VEGNLIVKTILITGATGLIGSNLLHMAPKDCTILTPSHDFLRNPLSIYPSADAIIHAAGYSQPSLFLQDPMSTISVNTAMTRRLLDSLKGGGTFLFCSSVSVYNGCSGPAFENSIGTTTPQHERSCYIESKRCGEAIVNNFRRRGGKAMVARLGTTYGPGSKRHAGGAISEFIQQALTKKKIVLRDDGTAVRTFCYVEDAAEILWAIVNKGTQEVYNVASPFFYSFREVAEIIAQKTKAELEIPITNKDSLAGASQQDYMDTSRMRREFNKYQYVSLENGLAATIAWQKELLEKS